MADKNSREIKLPGGGVFGEIGLRAKLILRLMMDKRVNFLLKLLPVGSVVYMFNPFDIPGPLDDVAIVSLGLYLFVELCPPAVVREHMRNLRSVVDSSAFQPKVDDEVVDAEFRETPAGEPPSNPPPTEGQ